MNFKCLKDDTATYISYINYFVDASVRVAQDFFDELKKFGNDREILILEGLK